MPSIAEFSIPAEEFALRETLERLPEIEIEIDRVVAHDLTHVLPFVWASDEGNEDLSAILDDDPSVRKSEQLAEYEKSHQERLTGRRRRRGPAFGEFTNSFQLELVGTISVAALAFITFSAFLDLFFEERNVPNVSLPELFRRDGQKSVIVKATYSYGESTSIRYGITSKATVQIGVQDIERDHNASAS